MEKRIDFYSGLYDAADVLVAESEKEILEAISEAMEKYNGISIDRLSYLVKEVAIGELTCESPVEIEELYRGKVCGTEAADAVFTLSMSLNVGVQKLLENGKLECSVDLDCCTVEVGDEEVELDWDLLGDFENEIARSLMDNLDVSGFKRG